MKMKTNLLINDHERFVGTVAHFLLQIDQLLDAVLDKLTFSFDQLFALFGRLVEETRVYFTVNEEN